MAEDTKPSPPTKPAVEPTKPAVEPAKYKVLRQSYINDQIVEEGAEVFYDGVPGSALEPINDAANAAKAAAPVPSEAAT